MSDVPLVSIVVPNYNNERFLRQSLESVLKQTYVNLEILIVDDCSTDSSSKIIDELAAKHRAIRRLKNPSNIGVAQTRHRGFSEARGQLIATLDSDDFYISEEKIAREVAIVDAQPDWKKAIGYSGIVHVDSDGNAKGRVMNRFNTREGHIFELLVSRACAIPRDFVFARDIYFEVGGFSSEFPIYEDWDLKLRLARVASYHYTGIDGIAYRQHNAGLSSVDIAESKHWIDKVFDRNTIDLPNREALYRELNRNFAPGILRRLVRRVMAILDRNPEGGIDIQGQYPLQPK